MGALFNAGYVIAYPVDVAAPLAYFLTWTTKGTWLRGDERGSIDRRQAGYGNPIVEPSAALVAHQAGLMGHPPLVLDRAARELALESIRETARIRGWELLGASVRTNHVHVVVAAPVRPGHAVVAFKANITRQLRAAGLLAEIRRPWTEGASTRWLWSEDDVAAATHYVLELQDGPAAQARYQQSAKQ